MPSLWDGSGGMGDYGCTDVCVVSGDYYEPHVCVVSMERPIVTDLFGFMVQVGELVSAGTVFLCTSLSAKFVAVLCRRMLVLQGHKFD